jgi:hypothetical protein
MAHPVRLSIAVALLLSMGAPRAGAGEPVSLASPAIPEAPNLDCGLQGDSRCEAWVGRFDAGTYESVADVATSANGDRVFVTGYNGVNPSNSNNIVVAALDGATGSVLWSDAYNGPGNIQDSADSIEVTQDGSMVIVAGTRDDADMSQERSDYVAIGYDATTGARRWVATHDSGTFDHLEDLTISPDGSRFYVTGFTRGRFGDEDRDYLTVGFDARTGDKLWTAREASPDVGAGFDYPWSVAVSPDGATVAVTGWWEVVASPENKLAYGTVAYEAEDGDRRWLQVYDIGVAAEVEFSPDSSLVHVAGNIIRPNGLVWDYGIVTYDATTGEQEWTARFDACPQGCGNPQLAVNPVSGDVYVSGDATFAKDTPVFTGYQLDWMAIALAGSTGSQLWSIRYDSLGLNQVRPNVLVPANGSSVVLAGGTQTGGNTFGTAVSLNPVTGAVVWEARHMPPGYVPTISSTESVSAISANRLVIAKSIGEDPQSNDGKYVVSAYDL